MKTLNDLYENETLKLWRFNPCDSWAAPVLKPIGRAVAKLTTDCPCCTGARILLAAVAGAYLPVATLATLGTLLVVLTIRELIKGEPCVTETN